GVGVGKGAGRGGGHLFHGLAASLRGRNKAALSARLTSTLQQYLGVNLMEIGAAIFFTDYSMLLTDLAAALEYRGFDSLWVAEHSHIPAKRRFSHPQGDAALTKEYYDVMDPFVTLSAAAAVTKRLKLGTAICLVIQRDTIQTAKAVASLDQIS